MQNQARVAVGTYLRLFNPVFHPSLPPLSHPAGSHSQLLDWTIHHTMERRNPSWCQASMSTRLIYIVSAILQRNARHSKKASTEIELSYSREKHCQSTPKLFINTHETVSFGTYGPCNRLSIFKPRIYNKLRYMSASNPNGTNGGILTNVVSFNERIQHHNSHLQRTQSLLVLTANTTSDVHCVSLPA
jgi:hypothetical protein